MAAAAGLSSGALAGIMGGQQGGSELMDFAGSAMQTYANFKEAKRQRKFAKHMFKHRYQYTMQDLRNAGLNPLLVSGISPGAAPPGSAGRAAESSVGTRGMQAGTARALANANIQLMNAKTNTERKHAQAINAGLPGIHYNNMLTMSHAARSAVQGDREGFFNKMDQRLLGGSDFGNVTPGEAVRLFNLGGAGAVGAAAQMLRAFPIPRFNTYNFGKR